MHCIRSSVGTVLVVVWQEVLQVQVSHKLASKQLMEPSQVKFKAMLKVKYIIYTLLHSGWLWQVKAFSREQHQAKESRKGENHQRGKVWHCQMYKQGIIPYSCQTHNLFCTDYAQLWYIYPVQENRLKEKNVLQKSFSHQGKGAVGKKTSGAGGNAEKPTNVSRFKCLKWSAFQSCLLLKLGRF